MRIVLLEDEPPAMAQLEAAVRVFARDVEGVQIVGRAETVRDAARVIAAEAPDLVIADIHLADGSALRLFETGAVRCPVIFATAYDAYLLQALELNSIDYLLKPIEPRRVALALDKYLRLRTHFKGTPEHVSRDYHAASAKPRSRLLVRKGAGFRLVPADRIAWLTSEEKITVLVEKDGQRHLIDETLADLEASLDAARFFRANRQFLVAADAVRGFQAAGKGRLSLVVDPASKDEVVVSQERAGAFRAWITGGA